MLQADNMPVDDAPDDESDDSPRQSYNFAPGYRGVVYRARVSGRGGRGAGGRRGTAQDDTGQARTEAEPETEVERAEEEHQQSQTPEEEEQQHEKQETQPTEHQDETQYQEEKESKKQDQTQTLETEFILQPMKWGLIPSWTFKSKKSKSSSSTHPQKPNYATTLKTINCRDDSLLSSSGIWSSIKHRNRCIIPAQGFFEWLNVPASSGPLGGKKVEKIPHYVKRKDGKLMLFAGLFDCAHYTDEDGTEGEVWSYTVITTSSCESLKWLHDRMPVILEPGSEELKKWLDPENRQWGRGLQELLKPFDGTKLEWYPVDKRVGKVGNDGEDMVVRKEERREERDIGSWFGGGGGGKKGEELGNEKVKDGKEEDAEVEVKTDTGKIKVESVNEMVEDAQAAQETTGLRSSPRRRQGIKREASSKLDDNEQPPTKKSVATGGNSSPLKKSRQKPSSQTPSKAQGKRTISATKNKGRGSPIKPKNAPPPGMQKITKFFGNSA